MVVGNKEHLIDLVKLLVAHDVDLARTRGWLYYKAEFSMVFLSLSYHICSHGHTLHALDSPILGLLGNFIVIVVIIIVIIVFLFMNRENATNSSNVACLLLLAKEMLRHSDID